MDDGPHAPYGKRRHGADAMGRESTMTTDYTGDHPAESYSAFVHGGARHSGLRDSAVQPRVWDTLRDLLVHVDGGQAARGRVQFAAELAARMSARLCGLHVTPPVEVPLLYKASFIAKAAGEIAERLAADARTAATIFRQEATRRVTDTCWFEVEGNIAHGISRQARYADLVILGQHEAQGSPENHPLPIAHSVVFRCGRPVLVVPAIVHRCALEKVLIAWDGSRESVRATHDALPLLRLSKSVQIVTMAHRSAEDNEIDTSSILAHLAGHGVEVKTNILQTRTAEDLRKQIERGCYDLLVMGGYSHPMWLEFVMGGRTQSILLSSKIPIFVSR
jgi:nucleotide-binding universal stress UspA family protein